jgi:hypothetical protein
LGRWHGCSFIEGSVDKLSENVAHGTISTQQAFKVEPESFLTRPRSLPAHQEIVIWEGYERELESLDAADISDARSEPLHQLRGVRAAGGESIFFGGCIERCERPANYRR